MGLYERPLHRIKAETTAHARRKTAARERSDRRAQQRLAWARFAQQFDGSGDACRKAMIVAMEKGTLIPPFLKEGKTLRECAPSVWCIQQWRALPPERLTVESLRHKPVGGRPRATWHPAVADEFDLQVSSGRFTKVMPLFNHLRKFAEARGIPAISYEQVRYRMAEVPLIRRVVGRHGKRAGIADAANHGAVPATYAHEMWVLDELELPVFVKAHSFELRQNVAVKPSVVLIVDGASGVIVSYFVANPLARGALKGADRDDIMSALLSGFLPEFAPPACARYAGWKPKVLRYDRAPIHQDSRRRLDDVGIDVPDLPGFAPWQRGLVEAAVKVIKEATLTFHGHADLYSIAEYASKTDLTTREAAVRANERITEKVPVLIENLWSMDRLGAELDTVVREFNEERIHDEAKMPRAARYGLALDADKLVSGRDTLSLLSPHRVMVQKNGIRVQRIPFEHTTEGFSFPVGSRVDLRVDPALRGLFAETPSGLVFLRPMRQAALSTDPASVSHRINAEVAHYDRLSRAAKEFLRQREVGLEQAELADAIAAEQLDAGAILTTLQKDAHARGETPRSRKAKPKAQPKATAQTSAKRGRTQGAPVPGVTPITQAPSLARPGAAPTPPVRRGIIKSFG